MNKPQLCNTQETSEKICIWEQDVLLQQPANRPSEPFPIGTDLSQRVHICSCRSFRTLLVRGKHMSVCVLCTPKETPEGLVLARRHADKLATDLTHERGNHGSPKPTQVHPDVQGEACHEEDQRPAVARQQQDDGQL